jgi:hypothetical protein
VWPSSYSIRSERFQFENALGSVSDALKIAVLSPLLDLVVASAKFPHAATIAVRCGAGKGIAP